MTVIAYDSDWDRQRLRASLGLSLSQSRRIRWAFVVWSLSVEVWAVHGEAVVVATMLMTVLVKLTVLFLEATAERVVSR